MTNEDARWKDATNHNASKPDYIWLLLYCYTSSRHHNTSSLWTILYYHIMLYLFPILIFTKLVFFNVYIKQSIVLTSYMTEIKRKKYLNVIRPLYEYFRFQLLSWIYSALFERFKRAYFLLYTKKRLKNHTCAVHYKGKNKLLVFFKILCSLDLF